MDFVDTLENEQDYQPRDRYYNSLFFRLDERVAKSNDQHQPDKGRHVTWAPMPESYAHRDRVADNLGRSTPTVSSSAGRFLKPPCPIHGHQRTRSINEISRKFDLDRSARNPQTSVANLYDLSSSCRYPLSSYYSRLYGQVESQYPTYDDLRNPSRFRTIPRAHLDFSHRRNPGYHSAETRPSSSSFSLGPSRFSFSSQLSLRKPEARRSVIGLNRWNVLN